LACDFSASPAHPNPSSPVSNGERRPPPLAVPGYASDKSISRRIPYVLLSLSRAVPPQRRLTKLPEMAGDCSGNRRGGRSQREPNPMDKLTDDLLIEILSRVPYRSLRRFACVSRRWRALIADPHNHRKLPQTLAGFFYHDYGRTLPYMACTGPPSIDPCLSFLPDRDREGLRLVDGCNGLLLCRCYRFAAKEEFDYLVINLATEKCVAVPVSRRSSKKVVHMARLGFEPAISSHFHVFEFQLDWPENNNNEDDENSDGEDEEDGHGRVLGVEIYSSETGLWSFKQSNWSVDIKLNPGFNSVFVQGMLYVVATSVIGAVDMEGRTWRIIDFPKSEKSPILGTDPGFIHLSQGKLHLANRDDTTRDKLVIWVLEDSNSEKWTLKHTVSFIRLVRKYHVRFGFDEFIVVAIHPDRNMVFFVFGRGKKLMSYDMDSREVHMISHLGQNCYGYLPYVPLFSESLADGQQ
ncbi:hypothetical protein EJB05_30377, partial [Eragrostis curvula]